MQYRGWIEWVERPIMERPYLVAYAADNYDMHYFDGEVMAIIKNTPENIAAFLTSPELKTEQPSMYRPVVLVTDQLRFVLSTMEFLGLVDECPHQRWLAEQLIPVLAPMQMGERNIPEVIKAPDDLAKAFIKRPSIEVETVLRELWPEAFILIDEKRKAVAKIRFENRDQIKRINKEIAPFIVVDSMNDKSETVRYGLILTTGRTKYQKAFSNWKRSHRKRVKIDGMYTCGSGQDWMEIFKTAFASDPDLERIEFDCEAGMFCFIVDDLGLLERFAVAFKRICDDTKQFESLIDRALDADEPFLPF